MDITEARVFGGLELWCSRCRRMRPIESFEMPSRCSPLCRECRREQERESRERRKK
ncbi:MAG: hypothetical protein IJ087_20040 [Eggerthellaceae bacterium]|nr:hypothetical protein [Eggerthellaceae bacterium]